MKRALSSVNAERLLFGRSRSSTGTATARTLLWNSVVPSHSSRVRLSSPLLSTHRTFSSEDDHNNNNNNKKARPDPFARRPNQKCDPYGQGGKPLTAAEAERLLTTVHPDWSLQGGDDSKEAPTINEDATMTKMIVPTRLTRSFYHPDFLSGAAFLNQVAAVAQMNDHFPSLQLKRQLDSKRKQWRVVSTVTCQTFVLQGLSHHDFFIATLIDVEMDRPEVRSLLLLE